MSKVEIKEPETDMIIGKALKIYEKVLYPVIRISVLKSIKGSIRGIWIVPIAIVVEENSEKFLIPLTNEKIDFDELTNH